MAETIKVTDLIQDSKNANRGTERGRYMLQRSLEKLGAGRSILLDKNGRIIAGNKTAETAVDIGLEDVVIVRTDGTKLVAVLRKDLDLDNGDGKARELAYADNRTAQVDIAFDAAQIVADIDTGLELDDWFFEDELQYMVDSVNVPDFQPTSADEQPRLDQLAPVICPHCGKNTRDEPET